MIPARDSNKLTGTEQFTLSGDAIGFDALSFCQWSSSEILGNTLRDVLAEYIVSLDLNCTSDTREEWDAYDLVTPDGTSIEVKSASYLQSWEQTEYSKLSFGIQPTSGWNDEAGQRITEVRRQADYYIFCVLAHKDMESVNPMAMERWEFYVLPTSSLNTYSLTQKTIALSSLLRLGPSKCTFGQISTALKDLQDKQLRDNPKATDTTAGSKEKR